MADDLVQRRPAHDTPCYCHTCRLARLAEKLGASRAVEAPNTATGAASHRQANRPEVER